MIEIPYSRAKAVSNRLISLKRRAEGEIGLLVVIWFTRLLALLVLLSYFLERKHVYVESNDLFRIQIALLAYFAFLLVSGIVGTYSTESFLSQRVKFVQIAIEICLYSIIYYLTKDPNAEFYFLYLLPMFVAFSFLSVPWATVVLGLASVGLYVVTYSLLGASYLFDPSVINTFVPRELFVAGITFLFALRRPLRVLEDVQEDNSQFISILRSVHEGVYVVDREGRLLFVNEVLERKHGPYSKAQTCSSYFHCDHQLCAWHPSSTNLAPTVSNGEKRDGRFLDRDGHPYEVEVTSCLLPSEGRKDFGAITFVKDVSHQKERERQFLERMEKHSRRLRTLTSERTKWLDAYYEMGKRLAGFRDRDELVHFVVHEVMARLDAETAALFLLQDRHLVRAAIAGTEKDWFPEESYTVGEGITGQSIVPQEGEKFGKPIINNNVDKDPLVVPQHLAEYTSKLRTSQVKHLIAVPLNGQDKSFGVLRIVNKLDRKSQLSKRGFTQEDVDFLVAIASLVAVALEKTRFLQEATQRLNEVSALYQASQAITSSLDIHEVLKKIVSLAGEVVSSDHTGVVLVDDDGTLVTSVEDHEVGIPLHIRARPNGITQKVIESHEPVFFQDVQGDRKGDHNPLVVKQGFQSYGGVPIETRDTVRGVLFVHSYERDAFVGQIPLLTIFCNQAVIAIENARFFKVTEQQNRMFEKLVEANRKLIEHTSPAELYKFCVETGANVFNVEDCSLYVINEERKTVDLVASSAIPTHVWGKRDSLVDGPGLTAYVARTGETLNFGGDEYREHDAWAGQHEEPFLEHLECLPSKKCQSLLIGPLVDSNENPTGVLKLENKRAEEAGKRFSFFEVALHKTLASHIGIAIERARLYEKLDEVARRRARERLSDDLHDIMSVMHGTQVLGVSYIKELAKNGKSTATLRELEKLAKATKHIYESLRRFHQDVRAPVLQEKGLVAALRHYTRILTIPEVTVDVVGRGRLPVDIEYALYRIGQEALTNAARHARLHDGGRVHVLLTNRVEDYELVVNDNGVGFDAESIVFQPDAFGFHSMYHWAGSIGAKLEIMAQSGQGTHITVRGCKPQKKENPHER